MTPNLTLIVVAKLDQGSDNDNASTVLDGLHEDSRTTLYRGTTSDEPGQWVFGWGTGTADQTGSADTSWKIITGMHSFGFPTAARLFLNNTQQDSVVPGEIEMDGISIGNIRGEPVIAGNRGHRGLIAFAACRRGILGPVDQANVNAWLSARFGVYPF